MNIRKISRQLLTFLLVLVSLIMILYGLVQFPAVQTFAVTRVANKLSKDLGTKVTVDKVSFRFFNRLILDGLLVQDRKKDTLLYAGNLKADVTDWFIFKDNIVLKNIELNNSVVKINRNDSVWNYQFLVDYFARPKGNKKTDIVIDAKEIHFNSLSFLKHDAWIGQDMGVWLKRLDLFIQSFDEQRKQLYIESLTLVQPKFSQSNFKGLKPPEPNLKTVLEKIPVVSAFQWNKSGWYVNVKAISLQDGSLQLDKFTERPPFPGRFDGAHIYFSSLNGSLKDLNFINDTLRFGADLTGAERSGLLVKKLKSNIKISPDIMEFSNLDLQTNNSRLGNYYAMRYKALTSDFGNFLTNVELDARFRNSVLTTDDLAFFAPGVKTWNRSFAIQGNVKGSVADLKTTNTIIRSGSTVVDGDLTMKGLPDIANTYIYFSSRGSSTSYNEVVSLVPALRKANGVALQELGNMQYTGTFSGFINDFNINGTLRSGLGNVTTDLAMTLPKNATPTYSGTISSPGFNVGKFIRQKNIGLAALNGRIAGRGFAAADMDANFTGNISSAQYNGYTYRNISVDATFKQRVIDYLIAVNDPNLQITSLSGSLALGEQTRGIKLNTNLRQVNLRQLGLSKQNIIVTGMFDLDFQGKTIDDFLGKAIISNATISLDSTTYHIDYANLNSTYEEGRKILSVESNELSAQLEGQFRIMELDDAFKKFLSRYYPTYIKPGAQNISNQNFIFTIKTNHIEDYIKLLNPKLTGFNNSYISGNLNVAMNDLNITADIPEFSFDGKKFINVRLLSNGNQDTLNADLLMGEARLKDSLIFPNSSLHLVAYNDISNINLKTSANKTLNDAELNAAIQNLEDGVKISFFPSQFVLNNKQWTLARDGQITIRRNFIDANEVRFTSGEQQIVISSVLDDITDASHLVASLKNVVIQDFAPLVVTNPKMAGLLSGTATLINPYNKPVVEFEGVLDSLDVNNKRIGALFVDGSFNTASGLVSFRTNATENEFYLTATGSYHTKDSTVANRLNIDIEAQKLNLKVLQPYMSTIFSDMDGLARGNIRIYGSAAHMFITGDAYMADASFIVGYTKCKYLVQNQVIRFREDLIDMGTLQIKDTLNNQGVVTGRLHHRFFKNFVFDRLRFETSKLLVLNTAKKDNANFYGKVIGRAVMQVTGNATNITMDIAGEPSYLDSSHIYLPTGPTKESGVVDYIDFIQFGELMRADRRLNQAANILVNLELTANPSCQVDVILDEETGDIIEGRGNGKLNITVGTREPLSIRGRYDITQGNYTFNFQTFLRKPFTINSGYISWSGDPYRAQIDMDAEYLAKNVDISSLTLNSNLRQKEDILISARLTGILTQPTVNFEFELPEKSEFRRDYLVTNKLANFRNDENAMNKQVASLLLFNSFILDNQNFLSQENTLALATNTVGGVISSWLTNMLNMQLEKATNGVISTYIDINPSLSLQSTANQLQANVRAGLKILLTSRINLLLGGNLDYNNPYAQLQDRNIFTPDITIEWLLNADGSLRIVGFTRTSYDITNERRNRSGVQLSYRKDFNKLGELFKPRNRLVVDSLAIPTVQVVE